MRVTVLPLGVTLPRVRAEVSNITTWDEGHGKRSWTVEAEIRDTQWAAAPALSGRFEDTPFEVAVIYPALDSARLIAPEKLTDEMIPKGVARGTVEAAVDVNADGRPELLATGYCCLQPTVPRRDCEVYVCEDYYERRKGTWVKVFEVRD